MVRQNHSNAGNQWIVFLWAEESGAAADSDLTDVCNFVDRKILWRQERLSLGFGQYGVGKTVFFYGGKPMVRKFVDRRIRGCQQILRLGFCQYGGGNIIYVCNKTNGLQFCVPKSPGAAADSDLRIGSVWTGKIIYINTRKPMVCNSVTRKSWGGSRLWA